MASQKEQVDPGTFFSIDIRVGTIVDARPNARARKPAYVLQVDFGSELGTRTSSAQLVGNYSAESLVGRQIVAAINFPAKNVAGVVSEFLVLAGVSEAEGVVLLQPERTVTNGTHVA